MKRKRTVILFIILLIAAGLLYADLKSGSGEIPLKRSAMAQHSYVVNDYYDKIAAATGSRRDRLCEMSIKGFQMVLDHFDDPGSILTRQLSTYYQAQCYRELGRREEYKDALLRCAGFLPPVDDEYGDTISYMVSLRARAEKELKELGR